MPSDAPAGAREIAMMQAAVAEARAALSTALAEFAAGAKRIQATPELLDALRTTGACALALEAAAASAKQSAADLRLVLATALHNTGGGIGARVVVGDGSTWSIVKLPDDLVIADPRAVPEAYMATPEPRPDRERIKAAIKAGVAINWATMETNRGYTIRHAGKGNRQ